jgi:putative methionine-R-sulfoxide reductase with GAF domain
LAEIRSQEALEKEKTRRDYEKLRLQLDDLAKEEQEARENTARVRKLVYQAFSQFTIF